MTALERMLGRELDADELEGARPDGQRQEGQHGLAAGDRRLRRAAPSSTRPIPIRSSTCPSGGRPREPAEAANEDAHRRGHRPSAQSIAGGRTTRAFRQRSRAASMKPRTPRARHGRAGALRAAFRHRRGADRYAADAALARGWRLVTPLPFSVERYEEDFPDRESKEHYQRLLWASRRVLPGRRRNWSQRIGGHAAPYAAVGRA